MLLLQFLGEWTILTFLKEGRERLLLTFNPYGVVMPVAPQPTDCIRGYSYSRPLAFLQMSKSGRVPKSKVKKSQILKVLKSKVLKLKSQIVLKSHPVLRLKEPNSPEVVIVLDGFL